MDKTANLEKTIAERWNETSARFLANVSDDDFRLIEVKNFITTSDKGIYLDVGCGKGRFMKKLNGIVIGLDISQGMLAIAKESNKNIILGSVTALPIKDNIFDGVFAIETIEHIPNTQNAISEMVRVAKKNGRILIIDRNKLSISDEIKENIFCRRLKLPISVYLHHKYHEWRNHHLYPRKFPFKEKWFFPWDIKNTLKKFCSDSFIEYADKCKYYTKLFPFTSHFIFWKGIK